MNDYELMCKYTELRQYVGVTDLHAQQMQEARGYVAASFPWLIDDFYAEILKHENAARVIRGGAEQVQRLKGTLLQWLEQLFQGPYDLEYVRRRWSVGLRHVEIGLEQIYTNAAMSRLRSGLLQSLSENMFSASAISTDRAEENQGNSKSPATVDVSMGNASYLGANQIRHLHFADAITRILDLDLALIQYAYEIALLRRQQRTDRLAAIGQMAGGIAHELRNPLNVIQTSLYLLSNSPNITADRQGQHLERMERQVKLANRTITALSDFTRLQSPRYENVSVASLLLDLMQDITIPEVVEVSVSIDPIDLMCVVDSAQIGIVIRNLIVNACEAMSGGGKLRITVSQSGLGETVSTIAVTELEGEGTKQSRDFITLIVSDTGCGIPEEVLRRLTEPLFTTKTRGLGLGLALTRAIVEKHGGQMEIQSKLGEGTTIYVQLPAQNG